MRNIEGESYSNYLKLSKNRPLETLERIFSHLEPVGTSCGFDRTDIIDVSEGSSQSFIFIHSGRFSVHRRTDGLVLFTASAPILLGIAEYFMPMRYAVLVAESHCETIKVPIDIALSIFDSERLWRDICQIQAYYFRVMSVRDSNTTGITTYAIIRNVLLELIEFPVEDRSTIVVLSYVQQRTKLSRSTIAKILADLRSGNYITMEHGHLISIKTLPFEY